MMEDDDEEEEEEKKTQNELRQKKQIFFFWCRRNHLQLVVVSVVWQKQWIQFWTNLYLWSIHTHTHRFLVLHSFHFFCPIFLQQMCQSNFNFIFLCYPTQHQCFMIVFGGGLLNPENKKFFGTLYFCCCCCQIQTCVCVRERQNLYSEILYMRHMATFLHFSTFYNNLRLSSHIHISFHFIPFSWVVLHQVFILK